MQNKPNFPKRHNNLKFSYDKELHKYQTLQPGPKQTQSNPITILFWKRKSLNIKGNFCKNGELAGEKKCL
jgi:hypothetical protein